MRVIKPLIFSPYTFERGTIKNYLAESGLMEEAAIDELAISYTYNAETDELELLGPYIEPAATNRIQWSNDFTNAAWELVGSPSPTMTPAYAVGVDGEMSATLFDVESTGTQAFRQEALGSAFSQSYFTIFVKATVPDTSIRITAGSLTSVFRVNVGDYAAFEDHASITPWPDGWFRCGILAPLPGLGGYITVQALSNDPILIQFAQLESHAVGMATSYIENEDDITTRDADVMVSVPPSVVTTSIPETGTSWAPATAYVIGDQRMVLGQYHRNYRALTNNTDKFPPDNPTDWLDEGATNPWRMFDLSVGANLQSVGDDIDVTVAIATSIADVVLFNVAGTSAKVTASVGDSIVYTKEVTLTSPISAASWWHWFTDERDRITEVLFDDLPPLAPATIRIQVFGTEAKLGKLVIGKAKTLGFSEFGSTNIGIRDFSTKTTDTFGNTSVVEREYKDKSTSRVVVKPGSEIPIKRYLANLRATPCAYVVYTMYEPILLLGFCDDFELLYSTAASSYCSLSLEGL